MAKRSINNFLLSCMRDSSLHGKVDPPVMLWGPLVYGSGMFYDQGVRHNLQEAI